MFAHKSILIVAVIAAATSVFAAPAQSDCEYQPDLASVACLRDNPNHRRDVAVIYDLRDIDEAATFLRRADALKVMRRGVEEMHERTETVTLAQNDKGSSIGESWHAGNGNGGNSVAQEAYEGDQGGSNIGSSCHFGNGRRAMKCVSSGQNIGVKRAIADVDLPNLHARLGREDFANKILSRANGNQMITTDSNVGNDCHFGNTRREEATVVCEQKPWVKNIYGQNQPDSINIGPKARANIDAGTGHDNTMTNTDANTGNQCHYTNRRDAAVKSEGPDGTVFTCTQTTSLNYGGMGGDHTLVQRPGPSAKRSVRRDARIEYDLRRATDVVKFHLRRAEWVGADQTWKREQKCDGTPIGGNGPTVTQVVPRAAPTSSFFARSGFNALRPRCDPMPVQGSGAKTVVVKYNDWIKQHPEAA
ncbi:hypothetical protein IE81DRAFT_243444 [Ceraceosorus guamensis]|uniref:Uncharacterized protein n=1 Tax=Ceraceosorus guamensis TaxID=1522189 RepID=A0A316W4V1_9BASI|nr:hypothetical protein IE81DRAFT_243444 [Ceraceosorus guamensis]PWN44920.1 hypothetical protein IE81DRAFT_243444 [Ceraceosorus guamensis]